jgi:hypothetical protein
MIAHDRRTGWPNRRIIIRHARRRAGPVSAIFGVSLEHDLREETEAGPRRTTFCGNQPAYHSMANRRSVAALHRTYLHQRNQLEVKASDVNLRPNLLQTDKC